MKIALAAFSCSLALAGMATGTAAADTPQHAPMCIDATSIAGTSFPDDKTIVFRMSSGPVRFWRNDLPRACPGMKFQSGITYEVRGGQLCSKTQVVYVIHEGIPCALGDFSPYTPPPKNG